MPETCSFAIKNVSESERVEEKQQGGELEAIAHTAADEGRSFGDRPGLDVYLCACLLPAGRGTQAGTGRRHGHPHASNRTSRGGNHCRHPHAGWRLARDKNTQSLGVKQTHIFTKQGRLIPLNDWKHHASVHDRDTTHRKST